MFEHELHERHPREKPSRVRLRAAATLVVGLALGAATAVVADLLALSNVWASLVLAVVVVGAVVGGALYTFAPYVDTRAHAREGTPVGWL
jgi:hypothetical protein